MYISRIRIYQILTDEFYRRKSHLCTYTEKVEVN